ncbi:MULTISPECIES: hypothetical protein [Proteiniphilum]|jgi:hypothetical protein|uniref:hypothetical protein n=1 Tax=Proteiniphilum TaxID=294702 RepID=UPI001EEA0E24|nr:MULTISPECIES: hypothetical protein [Proteiniphilum]ULB34909.1 hypothetical protein KDN43_02315 [Proteiniphilum propionicum]
MCHVKNNLLKWFGLVLFTLYVGGASLFTHTHVINYITYTHSHPYKFGKQAQHDHTEKELQLLDLIHQTSTTTDIIPEVIFAGNYLTGALFHPESYKYTHLIRLAAPKQLRAPPALEIFPR